MIKTANQQRLYYLDAMRSILMILGIFLHSANVFSDKDWAINSAETSALFTHIVDIIHLFRMPAFFIVSGFFCHMTLKKNGPLKFCKVRLPRILIPIFATALTLNILQNYILISTGSQIPSFLTFKYWYSGMWVSHLWFLNCLIIYFMVSAIIYAVSPLLLNSLKLKINTLINYSNGYYILIVPIISISLLKISYIIPIIDESLYDFSISESIKYSIYFGFGVIIGTNKTALYNFVKPNPFIIGLSILIITTIYYSPMWSISVEKVVYAYQHALLTWLSCILCFYTFHKFFNKHSKIFSYLADASYSIYLFHHVLIILFGGIIIKLDMHIWLKFLLLVSTSFIITNILHLYVVRRYSIIRYLFNGKKKHE